MFLRVSLDFQSSFDFHKAPYIGFLRVPQGLLGSSRFPRICQRSLDYFFQPSGHRWTEQYSVLLLSFQESSSVLAVGLNVTDGREMGNTVFLQLDTFKLQIFVVNNTGLMLPTGTWAIISSVNLTYTTNAPDQSINLR